MKEIWKENHVKEVGNLHCLLNPVLADSVFRLAIQNWYKGVDPDPESEPVEFGNPESGNPESEVNSDRAEFISELFEKSKEESFKDWIGPLMKQAIIKAKPLVFQTLKKTIDKIIKQIGEDSPRVS